LLQAICFAASEPASGRDASLEIAVNCYPSPDLERRVNIEEVILQVLAKEDYPVASCPEIIGITDREMKAC